MLLRVISVDGEVFTGEVEKVIIPTAQGVLWILPGHLNLVTTLLPGNLEYIVTHKDQSNSALESFANQYDTIAVQWGLVMIEDDVITTVLE